jgi:hypothetical protein
MTEIRPYNTATTPAAIATHNQLAASISKSPKDPIPDFLLIAGQWLGNDLATSI